MLHTAKYVAAVAFLTSAYVTAADFDSDIPMRDKGAATYYVDGDIHGVGPVDLMVDTGSGYMTINEETLGLLQISGDATYVKDLSGVLADGSTMTVPVYRITQLRIGPSCILRGVEAAVFPGKTRQILGMSALRQTAPFIFSMDPPKLVLSNCTERVAQAGG
ncbi:MAG: retroviral-like aspartic protease family protein [Gammaproteobacteria bacterium]|nr:retroviral-like aspartic protease family protein [Gammaproteobacteria bacterium]MBU2478928.1 retroviral-like aspartic protease family protein [Gammaproteobacteria bacterium]